MNTTPSSSSALSPDELFLLDVRRAVEAAATPEGRSEAVGDACARRPDLAREVRDLAAMLDRLAVAASPPAEPMPGQLGEFRIVRRLDHGGMGEIYLASHDRLCRQVAVKVIRPDRASESALERFRREQRALARLHQTHIVPIYAAGEEGPIRYFAMPYIEGAALRHVIDAVSLQETDASHPPTPPLNVLAEQLAGSASGDEPTVDRVPSDTTLGPVVPVPRIQLSPEYFRSVAAALADAALALQHAHDVGILHRDVKPGNLLIDRSGHCWVIDFGLAGWCPVPDGTAEDPFVGGDPIPPTGVHGTPSYMAPEQWEGVTGDGRTDVWGLGVTLYELLTLQRAFPAESADATRLKVLTEAPTQPRTVVPTVPADLEAICLKALGKDPEQRYATAREFGEDLRRWLRSEPTQARPAGPPRRVWLWSRRNPGWAVSLLLTLFVVGTALGLWVQAAFKQQQQSKIEALQRSISLQEQIKEIQLKPHASGWFDRAWRPLAELARLQPAPGLNDVGAALLEGLDAELEKTIDPADDSAAAFDATGKRVLLGGGSRGPRLYDRAVDRVVPFAGPATPGKVAFGKEDQPLALVPGDGLSVALWDLDKQQVVRRFEFPEEAGKPRPASLATNALRHPIFALATRAGRVAAAANVPGQDGIVVVWDGATGKVLVQFRASPTALAFSPSGEFVAAGDRDGNVVVWSVRLGKAVLGPLKSLTYQINSLAFTNDADRDAPDEPRGRLAAGGNGGQLFIWDLATRFPTRCLGAYVDVYVAAFNRDGTLLLSGGRGGPKVWDATTGRPLLDIRGRDFATGMAFSPDGKSLAISAQTGFGPNVSQVWTISDGHGVQTLRGLTTHVAQVEFSRDGRLLAGIAFDWQVAIWDRASGHLLHARPIGQGATADNSGLAFSRDGLRLAAVTGRQAKVWDVASGKELHAWPLPPALANRILFDDDDKKLLLIRWEWSGPAAMDKPPTRLVVRDLLRPNGDKLILYDIPESGPVLGSLPAHDPGRFVLQRFSDRGGKVGLVEVIEAATGKQLWQRPDSVPPHGYGTLHLDASQQVVSVMDQKSGKAQLMDIATGSGRRRLPTLNAMVLAGERYLRSAESPDTGSLILTLCEADAGGQEQARVRLGLNSKPNLHAVRFHPRGSHLVWGNEDGTVAVCDIAEVQKQLSRVGLGWK